MSVAGGVAVAARGLRREHPGVVALDGVDLAVEPGELVVATGPSGSGKTTLLALLGALDRPTAGDVLVDGALVTDRAGFRRDVVGFVFQRHNLLAHLDAQANVELPMLGTVPGRPQRRRRAQALLAEVGLEDRASHRAAHLSGGERQRVAVARALANDPRLLLADEPTGALDTAAAERVLALVQDARARRGTTVVIASHDPLVAVRADRVVHLRDGRVVPAAQASSSAPDAREARQAG